MFGGYCTVLRNSRGKQDDPGEGGLFSVDGGVTRCPLHGHCGIIVCLDLEPTHRAEGEGGGGISSTSPEIQLESETRHKPLRHKSNIHRSFSSAVYSLIFGTESCLIGSSTKQQTTSFTSSEQLLCSENVHLALK